VVFVGNLTKPTPTYHNMIDFSIIAPTELRNTIFFEYIWYSRDRRESRPSVFSYPSSISKNVLTLPLCCPYRALTGSKQQKTWKALDSGKHSQNDSARYGSCTNGLLAPRVKTNHHTIIRGQLTTVLWPFGNRLAGHRDAQSCVQMPNVCVPGGPLVWRNPPKDRGELPTYHTFVTSCSSSGTCLSVNECGRGSFL